MTAGTGAAAHWDSAYDHGDTTRSWYQQAPEQSLRMFDAAGIAKAQSVVDVGGGASTLVDALLGRGFGDVTVVDISAAGLRLAQQRLSAQAERVTWIVTDLLRWQPRRTYRVWHDRAVFQFLTAAPDREQYLAVLRAATAPGSVAIFGCFALDGPQTCSGLPVERYDAAGLAGQLGPDWALVVDDREEHHTPAGGMQPFTWAVFQRNR